MTNEAFEQLATTHLPHELAIGRLRFRVRPPTVREAVEAHALAASCAAGERSDEAALRRVLRRWLGWLPAWLLWRRPEALAAFLAVQITGPVVAMQEEGSGEAAAATGAAARPSREFLTLAIADYVSTWGGDAVAVYNTVPWPFFLQCLSTLEAANARAGLRALMDGALIPHMGKGAGKAISDLQKRARGAGAAAVRSDGYGAYAPPEKIAADRAALASAAPKPSHPAPPV